MFSRHSDGLWPGECVNGKGQVIITALTCVRRDHPEAKRSQSGPREKQYGKCPRCNNVYELEEGVLPEHMRRIVMCDGSFETPAV